MPKFRLIVYAFNPKGQRVNLFYPSVAWRNSSRIVVKRRTKKIIGNEEEFGEEVMKSLLLARKCIVSHTIGSIKAD